jgi:protein-tyrosine phosphatase
MVKVIDLQRADDPRDVVHRAVQALAEGGIVAFPTETVYGLAVSAYHEDAAVRLKTVKGRRECQPWTLAVKSADEALDYLPEMPPIAWRLARRCWPGPITLVVSASHPDSMLRRLPPTITESVVQNDMVGMRVPAHPTILDVMRMLAGPLILTSANRSGEPDAATAAEVVSGLGDSVQLVLDDGPSRYGQPSTVVKVANGRLEVLRVGVVPEATLRRMARFMLLLVCTGNTCRSPMAELLTQKLIAERLQCPVSELELQGVVVMSAGLSAAAGGRPSPEAVSVMESMQLDLSGHESRPVTEQLVRQADLIWTMTSAHRDAIVREWPDAAPRTRLVRGDQRDVPDPIGGPPDLYRQCAEQLRVELEARVRELEIG